MVAIGAVVAIARPFRSSGETAPADDGPPVLKAHQGDLSYEYHIPTGAEAVFDTKADPRRIHNVLSSHAAEARAMRHSLEVKLKVESLDDLRVHYSDSIRRLRALGYL